FNTFSSSCGDSGLSWRGFISSPAGSGTRLGRHCDGSFRSALEAGAVRHIPAARLRTRAKSNGNGRATITGGSPAGARRRAALAQCAAPQLHALEALSRAEADAALLPRNGNADAMRSHQPEAPVAGAPSAPKRAADI